MENKITVSVWGVKELLYTIFNDMNYTAKYWINDEYYLVIDGPNSAFYYDWTPLLYKVVDGKETWIRTLQFSEDTSWAGTFGDILRNGDDYVEEMAEVIYREVTSDGDKA